MKIIHIIENLDDSYGGPAKSVPMLVKYLDALGVQNKIFTVQVYANEKNDVVHNSAVEVIKVPLVGHKKIKYAPLLEKKILNELTADTLIHVHMPWSYPAYLGYKIAKKFHLPLVVSTRGTMYKWALNQSKYIKKLAWFLFQKTMLQTANAIHVTEKNEITSVHELGIDTNFILIPNGIELEQRYCELNQALLDEIAYDPSKRYILFLGRIVHNKGLHYLLNSFNKLSDRYNDIELLIVGNVEDRNYFNTLHIEHKTHVLGIREGIDKHTLFSIASLFVLPSRSENFGLAIAEAMSYKIPVITTTGTPWEELEQHDAGWWIQLTQENLDKAMEEALSSRDRQLKEKGLRCYNLIKKYDWNTQAAKMKQCYEKILIQWNGKK